MNKLASVSATIEALAGWRRAFVAIIAGVLWALAHVPFGVWPLIFVAGPLSFWLLRGGFRAGWLIGAVFFAITLHWIVEPFLIDATVFGWMAPFALVGMAGGLGLFWAVAFWAAQRFFPGSAFGLAGCWFMAEAARSYILTGFPWVLPAYIWVDTPVAQLSAMVGPYALSLITLVLAIAAFGLKRMSALASVAAVLAVSWVWGLYVLAAPEKGQTLTVRVVQPNIPQAEKWAPEFQGRNFNTLLSLSISERIKPDVVIWPEVAVPFQIETAKAARQDIAEVVGTPVILGSLTASPVSNRWRNSLVSLDRTGTVANRYDKVHLVPFGEYMPLHNLLASVGINSIAGRGPGIEPGEAGTVRGQSSLPTFAASICYEGVFPRETMAATEGAQWIALITNDAWFGNWAGPLQHLSQARMRAIETGLPIARSANTGITSVINRHGQVVSQLSMNQRGAVQAELSLSTEQSFYRVLGEVIMVVLTVLVFAVALLIKINAPARNCGV